MEKTQGSVEEVPEGGRAKRGRGRPKCFDPEAALEKAMMLFWDRGYEATSMDDLSAAMGISPSSIYATYGDKEKLFQAAVDRYRDGPGAYTAAILMNFGGVPYWLTLPAAAIVWRARTLSPITCMWIGSGPMKVIPHF